MRQPRSRDAAVTRLAPARRRGGVGTILVLLAFLASIVATALGPPAGGAAPVPLLVLMMLIQG